MLSRILRTPQDFRRLGALIFTAAAFAGFAPSPLSAQTTSPLVVSRITEPVDENSLVTLKGTVHPLAKIPGNDRGAAPDSLPLDRLEVVLKRSSAQEAALKQLITDMHTPGSASYHQWLTPDQFGQQFGPSDQDIAAVETWLQSQGFNVTKVNPGKQTIEISGNAGQFRSAFHAQIHKYVVNGETHYANASDPEIPAALAPVFGGFSSLNNFRVKPHARILGTATYDPKTGRGVPQWTVGSNGNLSFLLSPADFYTQYDLKPLYSAGTTGSGQTLAIINDSNININLVNQFRSTFGLTANSPQVIIDGNDPGIDGINNPDGPNFDSSEAYIDVEWSGAVAQAATVDLVIAADTTLESGLILAAEHAVYGNIAPVLSLSFGSCELDLGSTNNFLNGLWEQAAAQGITVMVSTGDSGSAGCDDSSQYYAVGGQAVSGYASTPFNVAVGGTDFYYSSYNQGSSAIDAQLATYWNTTPSNSSATASIQGYIPEQPWNDSQFGLDILDYYANSGNLATTIAGGSGGASTCGMPTVDQQTGQVTACAGYPKPAWQSGTGVPADSVRDLPDVSLFAADGINQSYYPFCWQDGDCQPASSGGAIQVSGAGGTSFAAPTFAGIMALVNQKYGRQGQADFVLYPLKAQFPQAFHDVTVGTNSVPCNITNVVTSSGNIPPTDCIPVAKPVTVSDPTYGVATEGQIGTGTTPEYNATAGYDLASGLGSIDANQLVANWANVKFTSTTVSLTSPTAGTSITHGSSVTFTGTVAGTGSSTPTGNVAIETDSTMPVQQGQTTFALSNGAFSGSLTTLPGGTYNVWANYGGDTSNASSASSKVQITVNPEASTTYFNVLDVATPSTSSTAIANGGTASYGTQLVLAAQPVSTTYYNQCINVTTPPSTCTAPTSPTGTVVFADNGNPINTAVLNAEGDAEYNAPWAIGAHSVTAKYSGDASYSASNSSTIGFTIVKNTPTVSISGAAQTSSGVYTGGQATVFTIQVENSANSNNESMYGIPYSSPAAAPTGTISVTGFPSGVPTTANLTPAVDPSTYAPDGVATIVAPAGTRTGTYNVLITYPGDPNYNNAGATTQVQITSPGSGLASTTTATATATTTSPNAGIVATVQVTGQSGKAAPTGSVIVFSSGFQIDTVPLPASSTDSATVSIVLNSQNLFQGSNLITIQYSGDKTYLPSATTLAPLTNPLSDFSMVPNTTIVPVTAGGSATDTIQLASVNGFSNLVNFTCAAAAGLTCSLNPTSYQFASGSSSTATLTVNAASTTAAGTYNVSIKGTDSTGQYIHTLGLQVVAAASSGGSKNFALTDSGAITVTAGSSGTSTISVTPSGGFTGNVALTCAVSSTTSGVGCSLSPTTANITGTTAATSTLTVTTTSSSGSLHYPLKRIFGTTGGVTLATILFFGIPARRRSWRTMLGLLVVIIFIGGIGCGGGGGGNNGGGSASYTVTVTGTSGTTTNSVSVMVTVNQ